MKERDSAATVFVDERERRGRDLLGEHAERHRDPAREYRLPVTEVAREQQELPALQGAPDAAAQVHGLLFAQRKDGSRSAGRDRALRCCGLGLDLYAPGVHRSTPRRRSAIIRHADGSASMRSPAIIPSSPNDSDARSPAAP